MVIAIFAFYDILRAAKAAFENDEERDQSGQKQKLPHRRKRRIGATGEKPGEKINPHAAKTGGDDERFPQRCFGFGRFGFWVLHEQQFNGLFASTITPKRRCGSTPSAALWVRIDGNHAIERVLLLCEKLV